MSSLAYSLFHSLFLATLLSISHSMLKWVSTQQHNSYLSLLLQYWYIISSALLMYGFIFFYYIYILKNNNLSSIYPIYTGLSIILVLISGKVFFSEPFSLTQVMGSILIILGIGLILNP